jgi:tetratricopeptide (TPR) repeat protein
VRQVIEGRLARLGDDARRLLEAAAVIGHEVEIDLWLEVSGADENTLVDTLERAIEARLVDELPDRALLRFTHALVRETLYEGLISLRLRAWHRKVAEILAARPQPDPDTVAFHLQTAGDPRAYEWLVRAGDRARRSFALADAIQRFERALGSIAVDPARGQERGWLLYRIAVLMRIEDPARALAHLSEAISLAEQNGDRALLAYGLFMKGLLTCFFGDGSIGIPQMRAGVDAIDALQPGDLAAAGPLYTTLYYDQLTGSADARLDQVRVNVGKGTLVLFLGVTARFADAIAIGIPFVESASRERLSMSALHSVADAYIGLLYAYAAYGDPARARAFGDLAIEHHQTIGSYWLLVTLIESNLSEFVILAYEADQPDRWQQAISQLQRLDELVRGTLTSLGGYEKGADRLVALRDARWDVLRDHNEQRAQMETQPVALYGMMALASAAYHLGDRAQAREAILQTGITPGHPSDTMGNSLWTIGVTEIACRLVLDEDDIETARAWIDMLDSFNDEHGIVLWRARTELLRVRLHRATGDLPAAEAAARRALELASAPRQPLSLLAAHRALAEILTASGRLDAAEAQLDQAVALAEACQMALETALTRLAEAALRLAQENHARAEDLLAEVRAFAVPRGGKLILEQVNALEAMLP